MKSPIISAAEGHAMAAAYLCVEADNAKGPLAALLRSLSEDVNGLTPEKYRDPHARSFYLAAFQAEYGRLTRAHEVPDVC